MNINSIRDGIPVGGDSIDCSEQHLELGFANGNESFVPLGNPEALEKPIPGEVIYVVKQSGEIMCRRWNWRNSHHTRITEDTHTVIMNIDGIGENSKDKVISTRDRIAEMLIEFCNAKVDITLLHSEKLSHQFG